MRIAVLILYLLAAVVAWGQQGNVPDVYPTTAQFERVIVFRFKFDADLLAGLEEMIKKEGIKNAVFLR